MMKSEKEREMEEEVSSVEHLIHEHPLSLIETDKGDACLGCGRYFTEEAAYGCKNCGNEKLLHQECAEMPTEIGHSSHPQHTLVQKEGDDSSRDCAACQSKMGRLGYFCSSSVPCDFQLHLFCTPTTGVKHLGDQQLCIRHPSHPQHELVLLKKRHSFKCDACGRMETGRSYVCVACQYWIHESCAALPTSADYPRHHHWHPLTLAFDLPIEYIKFFYVCDVCRNDLVLNRWVYHCQICRYVVHLKCVVGPSLPSPADSSANANAADIQGLIQFPINDVHEELIKPFVIRERGEIISSRDHDQKYWFHNHRHQLTLVVSSSISEIDDDDGIDYGQKLEFICDCCTMPIFQNKKHKSSSCSDYEYMSCGECKYFLHLACFHLPPELPSHPLHKAGHKLILQDCPKNNFWNKCSICEFFTNGLLYVCEECEFQADIKCASLPNTIKHGTHPQHHLHSKFVAVTVRQGLCAGCGYGIYGGMFYKCGSCDFTLCNECVLLPPVNTNLAWDKHPLPLRSDANLNHPDEFYCDACEGEMNPKLWMYHCRDCDQSFHPRCFPATSGEFRNIKFGLKYEAEVDLHPHPLTYRLLTTKLRCDVCRLRIYGNVKVDQRGFHCPSCNFFMCLLQCGGSYPLNPLIE